MCCSNCCCKCRCVRNVGFGHKPVQKFTVAYGGDPKHLPGTLAGKFDYDKDGYGQKDIVLATSPEAALAAHGRTMEHGDLVAYRVTDKDGVRRYYHIVKAKLDEAHDFRGSHGGFYRIVRVA